MKKAIVLLSGGIDSAATLYYAKTQRYSPVCLSFDYGQRHKKEISSSRKIAKAAGCRWKLLKIELPWKGSSLLDKKMKLPKGIKSRWSIPSTYVPARNIIFLSYAASYAEVIGAEKIFIGANQLDYSGYPDCRDAFIKAIEWTTNLGSDSDIEIHTPLMWLSKAETFELADKEDCLDQVIEMSHTCYNGSLSSNEWGNGCGDCPACQLRAAGYEEFINPRRGIIWKG